MKVTAITNECNEVILAVIPSQFQLLQFQRMSLWQNFLNHQVTEHKMWEIVQK